MTETGAEALAADRLRLEAVRKRVHTGFGEWSAEELDRRPSEDAWSVAECAMHMTGVNQGYLENAERSIREGRAAGMVAEGPFRYNWFGSWFLSKAEPSNTGRLPAPKLFRPKQRNGGLKSLADLEASFVRLHGALDEAEGLDLAQIQVVSPISRMLKFQLGIALRLLVAHSDRHCGQMERTQAEIGRQPGAHA